MDGLLGEWTDEWMAQQEEYPWNFKFLMYFPIASMIHTFQTQIIFPIISNICFMINTI